MARFFLKVLPVIGTWINIAAVIIGTLVGFFLRKRISESFLTIITQAVGLLTLVLGFQMSLKMDSIASGLTLLLSLVLGGIAGQLLRIDEFFHGLDEKLAGRFRQSNLVRGALMASLLFCLGPMTILGSLQDGLSGDFQLLLLKSIMDGTSSIFLAGSLGIGVIFSAFVILIYQGGLTLLASWAASAFTPEVILALTFTGGALVVCLGLELLSIRKIKVANFLPALLLAPFLQILFKSILP